LIKRRVGEGVKRAKEKKKKKGGLGRKGENYQTGTGRPGERVKQKESR